MQSPELIDESEAGMLEKLKNDVDEQVESLGGLQDIQAVVGIPFQDELDTLPGIVKTAQLGLEHAGISGRTLVLCVGPRESGSALIKGLTGRGRSRRVHRHCILHSLGIESRGWNVRALLEVASRCGAPLVMLPPDLAPQTGGRDEPGRGFAPHWILRLLDSVREDGQDLALAHFSRHPLAHPVESLLAYPVMTGVFGFRVRQPTPGVFAMSRQLIRRCLGDSATWAREVGKFGFDPWVVTRALVDGLAICEIPLGVASFRHDVGILKLVFHQVTHALLHQVGRHDDWWLARGRAQTAPLVDGPDIDATPPPHRLGADTLRRRFKLEFNHFDETLLLEIIPDNFRKRMEKLADRSENGIALSSKEWIQVVRDFLLAYRFKRHFHRDDIVDGLFPFFLARLAGFIDEVRSLDDAISSDRPQSVSATAVVRHEAQRLLDRQADLFAAGGGDFKKVWHDREQEMAPYLPRLGAWEFVPHVGILVPQVLEKTDGGLVWANEVYQELIDRYRQEFMRFISEHLDVHELKSSHDILFRVHAFMRDVEAALVKDVMPFDVGSVDGTQQMVEHVCTTFAAGVGNIKLGADRRVNGAVGSDDERGTSFQLTKEAALAVLKRTPPTSLLTHLAYANVGDLLQEWDPCDALARAAWTEPPYYLNRILDYIENDGVPEWFHVARLEPVAIDFETLDHPSELSGTSALSRLAGRVVMVNIERGLGGEFPTTWFLLKMLKGIIGVELFSHLWQCYSREPKDFGRRIAASIRGHWGRRVLSAHNAFENLHQRILVERLRRYADELAQREPHKADAARLLTAATDVYHLSITLPDAAFVPLSAWTWASFSRRGGLGVPTPLSSLVERDWATRDFLTLYMKRARIGDENTVDDKIVELIGQGRESENLREHLLGVSADADRFVVLQTTTTPPPPATGLQRPLDGSILDPIADHPWESRYVLNAAAVRLQGTVYILYRAFGDDEISRIGLAWSGDGIHIDGRLDHPIFEPADPTETAGTE
ncbi:MAG: hypothetical protein OEN01_03800, partial [Candidatus Krumholzibacteria bacterium]|nr:hypothetical protein [Candidatus Krumholzibacteria bacterium]